MLNFFPIYINKFYGTDIVKINHRILKSKKFAIIIIPILGILITLMGFHLANQEIYYGKPESSKTLQLFISLTNAKTREEASNNMKISKYFGCGTIVLIMTIIIALYKKSR